MAGAVKQKEINKITRNLQRVIDAGRKASVGLPIRDSASYRVPTIVTSVRALEEEDKDAIIRCWVNPTEMAWAVPQRSALQKVRGGTVRYLWRNRERGTFYDEMKVNISFASGNILPQEFISENKPRGNFQLDKSKQRQPAASPKGTPGQGPATVPSTTTGAGVVPPGLENLYQFFKLVDETPFTDDGRENFHIIFHTSPVFPAIVLKGWFDPAGITWTESAEAAWEVKWSTPFEVIHTTPKIWHLDGLRRVYGLITT